METLAVNNAPPPQAVVGIGIAEGGIQACIALLNSVPAATRLSFFVVRSTALDPQNAPLEHLRARVPHLSIVTAQNGVRIAPATVYVNAPDHALRLKNDEVLVTQDPAATHAPLDHFFQSLAETHGANAVGIVLSGSGSDGSLGIQTIKSAGGITFAQDASASLIDMPQSAIETGCIDFVLSPPDIGAQLVKLALIPEVAFNNEPIAPTQALEAVLGHLRERLQVDFSQYRQTSVHCRIKRRMALRGIQAVSDYAAELQQNSNEMQDLAQDLMISVTSFFRDPECFKALRAVVFPALVSSTNGEEPLRVWVVGCASGEEVYTIAIALLEYMQETGTHRSIRIFGTDINTRALTKARRGWYAIRDVETLAPDIRERYFVKGDTGYGVRKAVRELCTFAQHNSVTEPPLHRMDLVCCRNVLIYFQSALQCKLVPLLHFALKPSGFMFIGANESLEGGRDLFEPRDPMNGIYSARPAARQSVDAIAHAFGSHAAQVNSPGPRTYASPPPILDTQRIADLIALRAYAPPGVLVDDEGQILHYRGDVSPYLSQSHGRPSHSVFKVAREGLLAPLRTALGEAIGHCEKTRCDDVVVKNGDGLITLSMQVLPVTYPAPRGPVYWVFFEPSVATRARSEQAQLQRLDSAHDISRQLEVLTDELTATRQHLEETIESQTTLNENLYTANEEIQSANEELQSANEDLESSKEELESSNEAMMAFTDELRQRNHLLDQANDDLLNLFSGIEMAIVMVGKVMQIRRFTPAAKLLFNLRSTDIGRSLNDIRHNLDIEDLPQILTQAINEAQETERQVKSQDGRHYLLRVRPYRTLNGAVEGAMAMTIDIDALANVQQSLQDRVAELAAFDRHKNEFLAILAHELRNPLAPLRNAVQILRRTERQETLAGVKARDVIDRQVEHMSRLVTDLLDAARAQNGRIQLRRAAVDLRVSIEQVVDLLRPAVAARNQRISMQLPEEPVCVFGDSARLEQILLNLLNNAVKFTPKGGKLGISLSIFDDAGTDTAVIQVYDNGQGIEAELLKTVFELFSQADRSLAHSEGGLGIGLSLVRTLVGLHGGQVSVRSPGLGLGSTFEIRLPTCAPPCETSQESDSIASTDLAHSSRRRILVVEDSQDIRESTSEVLSISGFEVVGVSSGTEALDRAPAFSPDAILLDVGLPDMNGFEVARRLRAKDQFSTTTLIALTGYDSPEARTQSAAAGFNHHLTKPVDFDELARLLQ